MAHARTPDYLRDDPELQQEFQPRPLAGIDGGFCWKSPKAIARYKEASAHGLQLWRDRGASEDTLQEWIDESNRYLIPSP